MPKPDETGTPTASPVKLYPEAIAAVQRYIAERMKAEPGLRISFTSAANMLILKGAEGTAHG